MKYISTAIEPNGKIPLMRVTGIDFKYHGCWGICLGIWLVLTGTSNNGLFDAMIDPTTDNGIEMTNQMTTIATIVPTGIAPDESTEIKKKLRNTNTANKIPGTRTGVRSKFNFQLSPPRNLYK